MVTDENLHFGFPKWSFSAGAKLPRGKARDTNTHIFPAQRGFAVFTVNICHGVQSC